MNGSNAAAAVAVLRFILLCASVCECVCVVTADELSIRSVRTLFISERRTALHPFLLRHRRRHGNWADEGGRFGCSRE